MSQSRPAVTMGKPVAHRSHGNAGAVSGDVADATLNGQKNVVRACETPEFHRLYGCPHEDPDVPLPMAGLPPEQSRT